MKKLLLLAGVVVVILGFVGCPKIQTGEIVVNSTPTGAAISLDGEPTGKLTNSTLTEVEAGSHTIKLTLADYKDYDTTVTVTADETVTVNATLEYEGYGSLSVISDPTGASIWIDDVNTGELTPDTLDSLPIGSHSLKLTRTDYVDYETDVDIEKDKTTAVNQTLTLKQGTLTVNSTPTGASIELDGTSTGQQTNAVLDVDYGTHTVKLTRAGYKVWDTTLTVNEASSGTGTINKTLETTVEYEIVNDEAAPIEVGFKLKAGERMAVMITPPSYPFDLTEASYVPMGWADDPDRWNTECDLVFFSGNATNGPTTELARTSVSATEDFNFNWFDVSDLDLTFESGSFFFAVENKVNDNPGLALDGGSPEHHVSWMYATFQGQISPKWSPYDNINAGWPDKMGDSVDVILRVKGFAPPLGVVEVTPTVIGRSTYNGWPRVTLPAEVIHETPYFDPRNYR
ncbi:PEGA domain-containing protein [candidate division WOR-3 bacterium]|nr:PEGA domain-containing protein [candidate division WOR-3 bacterium]